MEKRIISDKSYTELRNLLSRNRDAGKGFVEVANNISHAGLTQWLIDWAKIHEGLANQLEQMMKELGGHPDGDTSLLGELHLVWIDLKSQWTNNDTAALLDECLRGEKTALKDYEQVIAMKDIPEFGRNILNYQRSKIKEAIRDLKLLKKSYRKMEETNA